MTAFDLVHWEVTAEGDIQLREEPLPLNYPNEPDVKLSVVYGYLNQYIGTLVPGAEAPILNSEANINGTVAISLSSMDPAVSVLVLAVNEDGTLVQLGVLNSGESEVYSINSGLYAFFGQVIDSEGELTSSYTNAQLRQIIDVECIEGTCSMTLIKTNAVVCNVLRSYNIEDNLGYKKESRSVIHSIEIWIQPMSVINQMTQNRFSINATHVGFTCVNPMLKEGDQLVDPKGNQYRLVGTIDMSTQGRVWEIPLESYQNA